MLLLNEGLSRDAWELETDSLCSVESQVQVLLDHIHVHILLLVYCSEIDGVSLSEIDELAHDNSIFHTVENIVIFWINGDYACDFRVTMEVFINELGETNSFFNKV